MFEEEYRLDFFRKNGFVRKVCKRCGSAFWTKDHGRETCGDTPCDPYVFIGNPLMNRQYSMDEMRDLYLNFFKERGHEIIPRNPVIARWRDDVLLVNASIYDFQPHVTSGLVPPPANPLTISQPCIRMTDLDSVGRTGKHISSFEMMAHHAFNYPDREVYWKEETVTYCHELLTETLGIDESLITYKEHPWVGGGNAGPSLEVIVGGLELATLVFMNLRRDPNGSIELDGERYSEMDVRVVDTGYGLERFVWASQGTPTIYEAVFPGMVEKIMDLASVSRETGDERLGRILSEHAILAGMMDVSTGTSMEDLRATLARRLHERGIEISPKELARILEPLENVYIITDHTKTIALMLSDGIVPSNVKAGYLARLLIRRTLRLMEEMGIEEPLSTLVLWQLDYWKSIMDTSTRDVVREMVDLEEERYRATVTKGRGIVERVLKKEGTISPEKLVELYDSHGLHPTVVRSIAREMGVEVDIPDTFNALLAERQRACSGEEDEMAEKEYDLPPTRPVYYEKSDAREIEARVIYSKDGEVVLDATPFYPEGGGQPADRGWLVKGDTRARVVHVSKHRDVIVHHLEKPEQGDAFREGDVVRAVVDWDLRMAHTRHHTATHILLGVFREVLGKHVWQAGSQNQRDWARLDIAHFRPITREEIKRVEHLANEYVRRLIPVEKKWMNREDAEKEYGFRLYQGGAPKSAKIRVVVIPGLDAEGCGGTHVDNTGEVGWIKIRKTERIQDGVERVIFSAGPSAIDFVHWEEDLLFDSARRLSVSPEVLPQTVSRFFEEWKSLRKDVERLRKYEAEYLAERYFSSAEDLGDGMFFVGDVVGEDVDIQKLAAGVVEKMEKNGMSGVVVFVSGKGKGVMARTGGVGVDCGSLVREVAGEMGGGGGGKPDFARFGGVKDPAGFIEAVRSRLVS